MAKYLLSPEAQNSLKQIKNYSNDQFGTMRSELNSSYRSSFVGSHTIYFRTKSSRIEIIDVLHQSMEPTKHLLEDIK